MVGYLTDAPESPTAVGDPISASVTCHPLAVSAGPQVGGTRIAREWLTRPRTRPPIRRGTRVLPPPPRGCARRARASSSRRGWSLIGAGRAGRSPSAATTGPRPATVRLDGRDVSGHGSGRGLAAARGGARRGPDGRPARDHAHRRPRRSASRSTRREPRRPPADPRAVDEALEPRNFGGRRLLVRWASRPPASAARRSPSTRARCRRWWPRHAAQRGHARRARRRSSSPPTTSPSCRARRASASTRSPCAREIAQLPERIALTPGPLAAARSATRRPRPPGPARWRWIARPISVTLAGARRPDRAGGAAGGAALRPDPPDLRGRRSIPTRSTRDIASAFGTREQPARDATFRISGSLGAAGPLAHRPQPRHAGDRCRRSSTRPGATSVRARFTVTRPERTTAQAKALKITELVSEFTTPYNCCEPRVTNIQRAAEILDGTIIPAGGRFSLNEALGQRTLERGFVSAPQIAAGRLEEAVGGGVSQVSTTMYNAAFFAGLAARDPHAAPVLDLALPEGPRGDALLRRARDDLRQRLARPRSSCRVDAGSNGVTVRFFSSKLGRRVETETGEPTDWSSRRPSRPSTPPSTPASGSSSRRRAAPGFTISYTREVYAGDTLKRDERYTWRYDAEDAFVKVGPRPSRQSRGHDDGARDARTPPERPRPTPP